MPKRPIAFWKKDAPKDAKPTTLSPKQKAAAKARAKAAGKAKDGPSKKVAREFIEATPKKAMKDLPEKASGRKQVVMKKKGGY